MQRKRGSRIGIILLVLIVLCCLLTACVGLYLWYTGSELLGQYGLSLPAAPAQEQIPAAAPTSVVRATGASPVLYLAGRSDITIPPLGEPSEIPVFSCRDGGVIQETFPPGYRVSAGTEFTFKATGLINFYGGPLDQGYPPDGDPNGSMASIESFGGISGYEGPAGALAGVFLTDAVPLEPAPDLIRFTADATGIEFARLEPQIGQVFFIGDGATSTGARQNFVAPAGATRLFIGLVDGSFFFGPPTCYADNVGSFDYEINASLPFEAIP
jgi:hypothetical protein